MSAPVTAVPTQRLIILGILCGFNSLIELLLRETDWIQMNHDVCLRDSGHDSPFYRVTDLVRHDQRHVVVQFEVQLNKVHSARTAGPQIVHTPNLRVTSGDANNLLSLERQVALDPEVHSPRQP